MSESTKIRVAKCGHDYEVHSNNRGPVRVFAEGCGCAPVGLSRAESARVSANVRWHGAGNEIRRAHASMMAEARWSVPRPRKAKCGHDVEPHQGRMMPRCEGCEDARWICAADGCSERSRENDGKPTKWCLDHFKAKRREHACSKTLTCLGDDCDRPRQARGMCSMHWKRWARENGLVKDPPWNDRRRDNYHARRARKNGAKETSAAFLTDILLRDGTDCAGCGSPVDLERAWPDPYSKSVDHVLPLSRGGAHSLDNVQLMHLRCNMSKGARVLTG